MNGISVFFFFFLVFLFCIQFAAKEHQQALDILDMEEPINKRLFEKCLKDESGLKDPSSDWEMSQSSVSNTVIGMLQ